MTVFRSVATSCFRCAAVTTLALHPGSTYCAAPRWEVGGWAVCRDSRVVTIQAENKLGEQWRLAN